MHYLYICDCVLRIEKQCSDSGGYTRLAWRVSSALGIEMFPLLIVECLYDLDFKIRKRKKQSAKLYALSAPIGVSAASTYTSNTHTTATPTLTPTTAVNGRQVVHSYGGASLEKASLVGLLLLSQSQLPLFSVLSYCCCYYWFANAAPTGPLCLLSAANALAPMLSLLLLMLFL